MIKTTNSKLIYDISYKFSEQEIAILGEALCIINQVIEDEDVKDASSVSIEYNSCKKLLTDIYDAISKLDDIVEELFC